MKRQPTKGANPPKASIEARRQSSKALDPLMLDRPMHNQPMLDQSSIVLQSRFNPLLNFFDTKNVYDVE
jgi:hypothetical protein